MQMFDSSANAGNGLPSLAGPSRPWVTLRPTHPFAFVPLPKPADRWKLIGFAPALAGVVYVLVTSLQGPQALLALGAFALFAVLTGLVIVAARSQRLEWDGQQVTLASIGSRQVIARAGEGQVVRAGLNEGLVNGVTQFWFGPDGRVLGRVAENQWDLSQLSSVISQARVPVVDAGHTTMHDLIERYPQLMPRVFGMQLTKVPPPDQRRDPLRSIKLRVAIMVGVGVVMAVSRLINGG